MRIRGRIPVVLEFPYGSGAMTAADWTSPEKHHTTVRVSTPQSLTVQRRLDDDSYSVTLACRGGIPADRKRESEHRYLLTPNSDTLTFYCAFERADSKLAAMPDAIFTASQAHWAEFWTH